MNWFDISSQLLQYYDIMTVRNYIRVLIHIRYLIEKYFVVNMGFNLKRTSSTRFITFLSGTLFFTQSIKQKKNKKDNLFMKTNRVALFCVRSSFLGRWFPLKQKKPRFGFSTLLWFLAPGQRSLGEVVYVFIIYIFIYIYTFSIYMYISRICIYVYLYIEIMYVYNMYICFFNRNIYI